MKRVACLALVLSCLVAACATGPKGGATGDGNSIMPTLTPAQAASKKASILAMRDRTLAQLYAQKPEAREEVRLAAGYAVFDSTQYNVVMLVESNGTGVLFENGNATPTYMIEARAGTGPGVGYKDFRQVIIFKSKDVLDQFRRAGADVSASADATMKVRPGGSSVSLATSFDPFITTYNFTDAGMLLQANWGGSAFLPYAQLNQP
ncbi:hypothetical protein QTH97_01525 [Variovorax sp. J22R24]|uniref:hypothetical protein n=1 Tax=Variovorax gracilis TaxID=3053502 RepID=UPI002577AAEC|nr:hypothetical protein [Variovorax sp. J22R24]MDM0103595.1 hypothetical protein [Variovorax sp. J22R24]